ncbi:MAG: hypothetical protein EOO70_07490 [Myxococcaceae bacterium]|nr:MAG: hypothetical protein EOO70_07490 [Myxococcaceae bacterium]
MAVGAPIGGWLAYSLGNRVALSIGGAIIVASGLALATSRFRKAVMPKDDPRATVAGDTPTS